MKKKKWIQAIAITCSILLACSGVGAIVFAQNSNDSKSASTVTSASSGIQTDEKNSKEETVYALTGADGSVNQIIVSDWLKNPQGLSSLEDASDLSDILNLKGDETFTAENCKLTWAANGNDIYYRGTSEKKLPVSISIKYQLDGKEISAAELAGKSGRVTMTFQYQNNETKNVTVNGKTMSVKVPFVIVTGMLLDGDKFSNLSVSNGKVVNDGNRSIVMGFALPGLQESLDISADDLEIPSSVTISADVTDFELDTTLTFVTNDLFNELDLDDTDTLDDLDSKLATLTDGLTKLTDGSSSLYSGLDTLLVKSKQLVSGIGELYSGAQGLQEGTQELVTGTQALRTGAQKLIAGTDSLTVGLGKLSSNSASLNAGAKQVFETLLSTANTQLKSAGLTVPTLTIQNYKATLNAVLKNLDSATVQKLAYNTALAKVTDEVTAAVNAQEGAIRTQVTAAVRSQVQQGVILTVALQNAGSQMTAEEYQQAVAAGKVPDATKSAVNQAVSAVTAAYSSDSATKAKIDAATDAQMNSAAIQKTISDNTKNTVNSTISSKINETMKSETVQQQINAAVTSASNGSNSITQLISQLDSYNQFYQGLLEYTAGVDSAYSGSKELLSGAKELNSGIGTLSSGSKELNSGAVSLLAGIGKLKTASSALPDGVSQLKDGAMQLSEGMKTLSGEEGLGKLIDLYHNDVKSLMDRLRALKEASGEYTSFAGSSQSLPSSVKFIYRTDSISVPDANDTSDASSGTSSK